MTRRPLLRAGLGAMAMATLGGCTLLRPTPAPGLRVYTLDGAAPPLPPRPAAPADAPVLQLASTHAAAGFDSPRILYRRESHRLDAFAYSTWAEPPARMLAPLLHAALTQTGAFRAIVGATGTATADYRLDTELVQLLQDFGTAPSQVVLALQATLVRASTRRVLAVRSFGIRVPAPSDDPSGGVRAANEAASTLARDVAAFCADAVRQAPVAR